MNQALPGRTTLAVQNISFYFATSDQQETLDEIYFLFPRTMNESYLKNLPEGWFVASKEESENLHKELSKELPSKHSFYNIPMKVVAHRRGATDDILCNHINDPERFTVIHLTWSDIQEKNSNYPYIEVDGNFEDFLEYEKSFDNQ